MLSPAHDRDTTYIAVHQYRGMAWEGYFRAVEAIMDEYGGRPHWGKRHFQTRPRWRSGIRAGTTSGRRAPGSTRRATSGTTTWTGSWACTALRSRLRGGAKSR